MGKTRIFEVHQGDRTYQGSIWDQPSKPWIPSGAKQVAEFEITPNNMWMSVTEKEYEEIQASKEKSAKESGKLIISKDELIKAIKEYSYLVQGDKDERCVNMNDITTALSEL